MAAPITTSGFGVAERLNPQYLSPAALTPRYDAVIPALSQGLGVAGQFAQIVDNAQERPIRRKLQQIQLDEARARMDMLPIQQQLQMLQLGEAQQQAAIPSQIVEGVELVGGEPVIRPKNLDAGFGNIEFVEEFSPRERVTRGRNVASGGVLSPFEKRETLLTGRQVAAEAEKAALAAESARALATQRTRGKDFEYEDAVQKYQAAVDSGDTEAAALYKARIDKLNTSRPVLTAEDFYDRNVAKLAAQAGVEYNTAIRMSRTPAGADVLSRAAAANQAAARNAIVAPKLSAADRAVILAAQGEGGEEIVAEIPVRRPAASGVAQPKSKAEYDALPSGTQYIGQDGKLRIKK